MGKNLIRKEGKKHSYLWFPQLEAHTSPPTCKRSAALGSWPTQSCSITAARWWERMPITSAPPQCPGAHGWHTGQLPAAGEATTGENKKTPPAPRRHLGLFVHLSFRFDTSELAVCCSSAASAEIAVCELPANWGGWVETEFSLYFCFQKSLLALGEAAGAAWFHVCLLVTVTCLQLLGARARAGKALSLSLLRFFPPYYPLSRVLKTALV